MRFGSRVIDAKYRSKQGLKRFELVHFPSLPEGVENSFARIAFVESTLNLITHFFDLLNRQITRSDACQISQTHTLSSSKWNSVWFIEYVCIYSILYSVYSANQYHLLCSKMAKLEELEEVDLSGNRLKAVPTTILNCRRMHTLVAHSNCIEVFPEVMQLMEMKVRSQCSSHYCISVDKTSFNAQIFVRVFYHGRMMHARELFMETNCAIFSVSNPTVHSRSKNTAGHQNFAMWCLICRLCYGLFWTSEISPSTGPVTIMNYVLAN